MKGERDTEMEEWDLAISVEYLTFIQMITPPLSFKIVALQRQTERHTVDFRRTPKKKDWNDKSYFSNHFKETNTAFWFKNKVA